MCRDCNKSFKPQVPEPNLDSTYQQSEGPTNNGAYYEQPPTAIAGIKEEDKWKGHDNQ